MEPEEETCKGQEQASWLAGPRMVHLGIFLRYVGLLIKFVSFMPPPLAFSRALLWCKATTGGTVEAGQFNPTGATLKLLGVLL